MYMTILADFINGLRNFGLTSCNPLDYQLLVLESFDNCNVNERILPPEGSLDNPAVRHRNVVAQKSLQLLINRRQGVMSFTD